MAWKVTTIEPSETGSNYLTIVEREAGHIPDMSYFNDADKTGRDMYKLRYKTRAGASAYVDIWDTGIKYTGRTPHEVTILINIDGGDTTNKDTPEVADGGGGMPVTVVPHKFKRITSYKIYSGTRGTKKK